MPILHITHSRADADSFASAFWGYKVVGGGICVFDPDSTVQNLMRSFKVKNTFPSRVASVFVYDTTDENKIPVELNNYSVFDHHPVVNRSFVERARFCFIKPRSSNVMNLYDLSKGFHLPPDVLLAFSVALVTDTAFLKTARGEELHYLGHFLGNNTLESVYETILKGKVKHPEKFLRDLSQMQVVEDNIRVGIVSCEDDDEFLAVIDGFMYPLDLAVVVGRLPWGTWVYCKKREVQKVYSLLTSYTSRKCGRIYDFHDTDDIVKKILDLYRK